jgi:hypothetical protein
MYPSQLIRSRGGGEVSDERACGCVMCCSVTAGELTDEYRVGFRQKVRHPHVVSFVDQLIIVK